MKVLLAALVLFSLVSCKPRTASGLKLEEFKVGIHNTCRCSCEIEDVKIADGALVEGYEDYPMYASFIPMSEEDVFARFPMGEKSTTLPSELESLRVRINDKGLKPSYPIAKSSFRDYNYDFVDFNGQVEKCRSLNGYTCHGFLHDQEKGLLIYSSLGSENSKLKGYLKGCDVSLTNG
jgi:hypothetical protein